MPRLEPDPGLPFVLVSRTTTAGNQTGEWRTLKPVIDLAACTGCLLCWKFCPEACVGLRDGKPMIDFEHCKGCGICVQECPPRCVHMVPEGS